ncbi:MAG: alpha/beta hydrolase [Gemmatimonadaceae bacterium]
MVSYRMILRSACMFSAAVALACAGQEDQSAMEGEDTTGAVATEEPSQPDDRMQQVLDQLASLGGEPIATLTPAQAREQPTPTDAVKALLAAEGDSAPKPAVTTSERTISSGTATIPVTVYKPEGASGALPVVVYYHGGGWVIANPEVYDASARALSEKAQAVVVSVDYRQGPENRFPAAHDDALAAYRWTLENAASIGGDPARVALVGESAGGGLALATAIAARGEGLQAPAAIVSIYPIAGTDTTTESYQTYANAKPLNRAMMSWFFENYLRSPADRQDPRVNLIAADLRALPKVTIINAEIDPLRSDGELMADALREAGVEVEQNTYEGVTHEFFGMGAVLEEARDAQDQAADALRDAFDDDDDQDETPGS